MNHGELKKTTVQLIKYGMIGVSNTLLTLVIIFILVDVCNANLYVANIIGYVAGVANSFLWNKKWVFTASNNGLKKEMALFLIGFGICYMIQIFSVWAVLNYSGVKSMSIAGICEAPECGEYISTIAGMVIYTLCNYCYNRFVTFKVEQE